MKHFCTTYLTPYFLALAMLLFFSKDSKAQCPQFYDGTGTLSSNPYWISCSGGAYTVFLQSNVAIAGGYSVNWGDGSPNSNGINLTPPAFLSHNYAAAIDTFVVTVTTVSPACTVTGVVVMESTPSAAIQIPAGNPVYGCTPALFRFLNSSTNISGTTRFTWNFGDGTATEYYDESNLNQTLSHTYAVGSVTNCNVAVTLTAENYCNRGNPSINIYQPIQVWDRDVAAIRSDYLVQCFPNTTFHFDNNSTLNCFALGNNTQRYERWDFGNYWGLGQDSIVEWQPFRPPNRPGYNITYPGLGSYTVFIQDSNFCGVNAASITVSVVAPPVAALTASKDTICQGQSITFTNNSTGAATQYTWNFGDGTVPVIRNTTASVTHTFNGTGPFTVTLTADILGANGCTSIDSVHVFVKPRAIANFSLSNNSFCDSGTVVITESSVNASQWDWTFGNGNVSSAQNPPDQSYVGQGTYPIKLIVTSANGCTDTRTRNVNIYDRPVINMGPRSVCQNSPIQFIDSTDAGGNTLTNWTWNFGDGSATSNQQNPFHTYTTNGTYQLILEAGTANCSQQDTFTIVVNVLPTANYTQSTIAGCTILNVSFNNTSSGAISYVWDFGDGSPSNTLTNQTHAFSNTSATIDSIYQIKLVATNSFGCKDSVSNNVTVYFAPRAQFISNYTPGCSPLPVNFTNQSTGATGYTWNFGDGAAISATTNPAHIFNNTTPFLQTYTITLTATSIRGCTNATSQNFNIYPQANFSITALPQDTGCAPLSVAFGASTGGAQYNWDFGNGTSSVAQNPTVIFTNTGSVDSIFNVVLYATSPFACKDTVRTTILVHPSPDAFFTRDVSIGCSPLLVNFTDNSLRTNFYNWDFGDGSPTNTTTSPAHTFTNNSSVSTTYYVKETVLNNFGCIDTMIRTIEIYPKVTANYVGQINGCSPLPASFSNTSINGLTYTWDFGDGTASTSPSPTHTFINNSSSAKNDTIQLVAQSTFGCTDTLAKIITIYHKPIAQFIVDTNIVCAPTAINFTNQSLYGSSVTWNFGDGSPNSSVASPTYTYNNFSSALQNYQVTQIIYTTNSCSDTAVKNITVYPDVTAQFSTTNGGCSPVNAAFNNISTNANSYSWNFGDGSAISSQTAPTHTYTNNTSVTQTVTIKLVATSNFGCKDSTTKNVPIFHKPQAAFTLGTNTACAPFVTAITNQALYATTYNWNFGDGSPSSTSNNPTHTYQNLSNATQNYTLTQVVSTAAGCADTATSPITVYPQVIARYSTSGNGCSPLDVTFVNSSTNADNYNWNLGDGTFTTQSVPSHTYINNGTSSLNDTIVLIASSNNGCIDTAQSIVTIYHKPIAGFTNSNLIGCSPFKINTYDQSQNATSYNWDFGDGSPAKTTIDANNTYINGTAITANFTIRQIVSTTNGCSDTLRKVASIYPEVTAAYTPVIGGCSPIPANLNNLSINANTYSWSLGDGATSTQTNPTHTYVNNTSGTQNLTVTLISYSIFGCSDTAKQTLTIYHKPKAGFINSTLIGCSPLKIAYTDQTQNTSFYSWDFGDGSPIQNLANPIYTYHNNSAAVVNYQTIQVVTTTNGCADTLKKNVTVYPKVTANFTTVPSGCSPITASFTNLSTSADTYDWNFGDGSNSPAQNPSHVYFNNTTATQTNTITLAAQSQYGCVDTIKKTIDVYNKPTAGYTTNVNGGCSPLKINFTNQSIGGSAYNWSFGGLYPNSSQASPQLTYINNTDSVEHYNVRQIVLTSFGCRDTFYKTISVYPKVTALFSVPAIDCSPWIPSFTNQSLNSSSYIWNFGDGSPITNASDPTHAYNNTTTNDINYTIKLISLSNYGCSDTIKKTITAAAQPIASFTANPVSQTYPDATVSVTNTTQGSNWTYQWAWGDTNTETLKDPLPNVYDTWGNYTITLIAKSATCSDTVTQNIVIIPPVPIAIMALPSDIGCRPFKICFDNTSKYATNYLWDFGDGTASNLEKPCYSFYDAGTFNVKLTVIGPGGQNSTSAVVIVHPTPNAAFTVNPTEVEIPTTKAFFLNLSKDASSYTWDFGDGETSTEKNPDHTYTKVGGYDVTLVAVNTFGCKDTFTVVSAVKGIVNELFVLPNAFTPDPDIANGGKYSKNDLTNNVFFPYNTSGIDEYRLSILNRWGELIFESTDVNIGWDGYYRDQICQQDVYVWIVEGTYRTGERFRKVGDVTLIR